MSGFELESSGRISDALNPGTIFLALKQTILFFLFFKLLSWNYAFSSLRFLPPFSTSVFPLPPTLPSYSRENLRRDITWIHLRKRKRDNS